MSDALTQLVNSSKEAAVLQSIEELLNWDQRTLMPPKAAEYRAEQITLLSGLLHEKITDPRRGEWLKELGESEVVNSDEDAKVNHQRLLRQFEKESKVPRKLVEELSKTRVLAHEAWVEAREKDDFSAFSAYLKTIVKLMQEKTQAIGFETCAYDVLLDDYEPDAKSSEITQVFAGLRDELVPLIEAIQGSDKKPQSEIVSRDFDVEKQKELGILAAKQIGFDFDAGRLDTTHHPFCTTLGPNDCRITTRYFKNHFNTAFFGTLHEAGHGLYEQGLRKDQFGLPTGEYCSLGIHESQSRLWENMVGRSLPFWNYFYSNLQSSFPETLNEVDVQAFFGAVNQVEPSLIRVEADEATYSLHIIIRFELEQEIFNGEVTIDDLPDAWRQKYAKYLRVSSETDRDGVLQDVHWSEALFGYFPTYALGNLYAAHFFDAADKAVGGLNAQMERGEFEPLLSWLRQHVHQVGKSRSATEILVAATGDNLSHTPFMDYLRKKYADIYDI